MTKHGANGNGFAYNYSCNPYRNGELEYPQDYCGDISLHGHYSFANLFEGNIVQTIYIDQTWGPSGPYNTFFRNSVERYGLIMTSSMTNYQNFVGNEITGTGYTFPFTWGAYTITGSGHIQYGNNDNGIIVPSGTSTLNDESYYLDAEPSYWNVAQTWPDIGAPNAPGYGTIPAKERYNTGDYTDCNQQGIITNLYNDTESIMSVYPNPSPGKLFILFEPKLSCQAFEVVSMEGKPLIKKMVNFDSDTYYELDLYPLKKGLYFLIAETSKGIFYKKIVRL
jgi:hypothetical protein